jgi:2'-5' RNA ligase
MRLFVSINFSDKTLDKLTGLQDELRKEALRGRFVARENLHLTLAFLGDCDSMQTAIAKNVLGEVDFSAFELMVDGIGRFKRDDGDIWWAGVARNWDLLHLQKNLAERLAAAGFGLDKRKYSPHITLGRDVIVGPRVIPRQTLPFGEEVSAIELMRSDRKGGMLMYTAIDRKGAL